MLLVIEAYTNKGYSLFTNKVVKVKKNYPLLTVIKFWVVTFILYCGLPFTSVTAMMNGDRACCGTLEIV